MPVPESLPHGCLVWTRESLQNYRNIDYRFITTEQANIPSKPFFFNHVFPYCTSLHWNSRTTLPFSAFLCVLCVAVSQVFAANSSRTAPSVPRVPRAAFRDGHAQQFPRRLQQEPRVVISGVRDPDETSQSRVSTSSLASPPLRRNQREIRVPPHQDEAVMTYALYNSQGNGQSLPLFESSLESLGPGLVGRNSLRSVHSVNSQRELPSGRARAFKSDAADKQGDQFGSREGNLAPSNSSQFRSSPRPPSWASLHASHTAAGLEQRQSEADTTSVGAAGGGGGVPLLPSGPRNFSLHSDPRLEGPAERRKSPQLREGAHRLYSLQLSGSEVNPEFQDVRGLRTYGQYSEEAQNTKWVLLTFATAATTVTTPSTTNITTNITTTTPIRTTLLLPRQPPPPAVLPLRQRWSKFQMLISLSAHACFWIVMYPFVSADVPTPDR